MTGPHFQLTGPTTGILAHGIDAALPPGPATPTRALALLRRVEHRRRRPSLIVGAIPFDRSAPARLYVPREATRHTVTTPTPTGPPRPATHHDLPDTGHDPAYHAAVTRALTWLRGHHLDKVVLARALDVIADAPIDVDALTSHLARGTATGYTYRVDLGDPTAGTLVGLSPELLIRVTDGHLTSNPLAGSAPRAHDPAVDAARRARLTTSGKDQREHHHVVAAVDAALTPLTTDLRVPPHPEITATADLWHLSTTVTGTPRPGVTALDLALALHPTPAVCGAPTDAAADLITQLETVDRGFYSGLVGWMDADGNGEWVIALRGGLVRGPRVRVHAGAGVIADSEPDSELKETAAKMLTFLRALTQVSGPVRLDPPHQAVSA